MADDPTWSGLGEGVLMLAIVWWAWIGYSWLTNAIDPDENENRIAMFVAMGEMLIVSLAIPGAFGDDGALFACAYFVVRAMQVGLYVRNGRRGGDADNLEAYLRMAPALLLGSAVIVAGGFLDGDARVSVWIVAVRRSPIETIGWKTVAISPASARSRSVSARLPVRTRAPTLRREFFTGPVPRAPVGTRTFGQAGRRRA